jgi:hypothetical protein
MVDDHDVFGVAGLGIKMKSLPGRSVSLLVCKCDKGAVRVGLPCDPTFREVHSDVAADILPAADRLVCLRHCGG